MAKKIQRILTILNALDSKKRVYTKKMADELGVAQRTIQRDINTINLAGFPVAKGGAGYYEFPETYSLKRVSISGEEASLLAVLSDVAGALGENFKDTFEELKDKLRFSNKEAPVYVKMDPVVTVDPGIMIAAARAISENRKLHIYYESRGREVDHVVEPYYIGNFKGFSYLITKKDGEKGFPKYRMDKIKNIRLLKESFSPLRIKYKLEESMNIWFDGGEAFDVELNIDGSVAEYFEVRKYFPAQQIIKKKRDGSIVIKSNIYHPMEVIPTVLEWIPYIRVIKPKKVRDEVERRVAKYIDQK